MKKWSVIFVICMLLSPVSAWADQSPSLWNATIYAKGQDLGGVREQEVVFGVGLKPEKIPSPPGSPKYSVETELFDSEWKSLSKDIRQLGKSVYMWVIAVDPHGNVMPPTPRTSMISWNPSEFGNGSYELRQGYDGTGEILIPDMKAVNVYDITGTQGKQYFTLVYTQ